MVNECVCVFSVWLFSKCFSKQVGGVKAGWNVSWFHSSVADLLPCSPDLGRHVSVATCEVSVVEEGDRVHCVGVDDGGARLWAVAVVEEAAEEEYLLDAAGDGNDL